MKTFALCLLIVGCGGTTGYVPPETNYVGIECNPGCELNAKRTACTCNQDAGSNSDCDASLDATMCWHNFSYCQMPSWTIANSPDCDNTDAAFVACDYPNWLYAGSESKRGVCVWGKEEVPCDSLVRCNTSNPIVESIFCISPESFVWYDQNNTKHSCSESCIRGTTCSDGEGFAFGRCY